MNLRLKRTPGIYLVGFMGSGKTTIGRLLAQRLGWSFADLDEEIEAAERAAISAIFEERGEPEFRRIEAEVLRQHIRSIERGKPAVIAMGGGAFAQPQNREIALQHGIAFWLDCPFETVQRRVGPTSHRPLARDPERFADLYRARRDVYELADVRIVIDCDDPAVAVEAIASHPILQ
jgi:shikimate kinase